MNRRMAFWRRVAAAGAVVLVAAPASAQVDPLLFLKTAAPNVIMVVDTSHRMQRSAPTNPATVATSLASSHYYDPFIYTKNPGNPPWQASIGVTDATTNTFYRRRYNNLDHVLTPTLDRYTASTIQTVGDQTPVLFSFFEAQTRLAVARAALYQAVNENRTVARFSLMKMRQTNPTVATQGNAGPAVVADPNQQATDSGSVLGQWRISRPTVGATNNGVTTAAAGGSLMARADIHTPTDVMTILARNTRTAGGLLPAGNDDINVVDAPVKLLLDDARSEAARLIAINSDPTCRNTVVVMVVGGGEGTTSGLNNAALDTAAANFLNVGGRRVPVYVIAIAPATEEVDGLRAVATRTGGQYFEISKAQIDTAFNSPGQYTTAGAMAGTLIVPEVVRAVNVAIQHAFVNSNDLNTLPTAFPPIGRMTEHQVTSPIIGSVNLDDGRDITGAALVPNSANVLDKQGVKIPLRSNLLVTAGFSMPGFDGVLRGFRVYKPVSDSTQPSGYKFVSDGTLLWKACVPGAGCAAAPDASRRNLYTATTAGTMIAFDTANAAVLAPMMNMTLAEATNVITAVREMPLGAVVSSTPAIMNPPSLDPPPDVDYPAFRTDNEQRRSIVWVGTNNGILEAIDARFGVEVWGFIPLNLLPKLKTLVDGQPVGSFAHFVDSSPKISDVKYADRWHTSLIIGEGAGGTFYQSFDVTLSDMESVLGTDSDASASIDQVLNYFANPGRITLNWAFPSYANFDPTIAPYGDVAASATAVEKTVGQTWSDPAVGQIVGPDGPFAVLLGSGFLPYAVQQQANRGGVVAGTTFYIVDAGSGAVLASRDVGSDGVNETNNDCATDNGTAGCQRIKNALQSDPVATGPSDSRYVTKTYVGDLDGNLWRFDIDLTGGSPSIAATTKLYAAGPTQPLFNSMATVMVGTRQYVFFGTGSDLLPQTDKNTEYRLLGILDGGSSGSKTFEKVLTKTSSGTTITSDERVTAFPAVAGDIVFFTTTLLNALCSAPDARLYAFTFIGGPAYDNTGDNVVKDKQDTPLVKTVAGQRATAPFIVDQHVVFGAGGSNVQMFGDSTDYNNGIGQAGVRILSWREVR
jgi:hypothetical protein